MSRTLFKTGLVPCKVKHFYDNSFCNFYFVLSSADTIDLVLMFLFDNVELLSFLLDANKRTWTDLLLCNAAHKTKQDFCIQKSGQPEPITASFIFRK